MELFHKHNHSGFPDSLRREAEGLAVLSEALEDLDCPWLGVPQVISVTDHELVLPAIESAPPGPELMAALGDGLARIHRKPNPRYGLANDNYCPLSTSDAADDRSSVHLAGPPPRYHKQRHQTQSRSRQHN